MTSSSSPNTESITVRLGSLNSQVDAAAVASTMQAIVAIVNEAQKGLKNNEQVLLKARPFAAGSFEMPLDLIVMGAVALFEIHPVLDQLLDMLKGYIDIKKLLKGQPVPEPTDDGTYVIQGNNISISNSVVNILSNSQVNAAMDQAVADISADEAIRDLEVLRAGSPEPFIKITSTEFKDLRSQALDLGTDKPNRDRTVKAMLTLRSPVFEGSGKWRFNYDGVKIAADIRDESFKRKVIAGLEQFAAGDRLEVDLVIAERYNPAIADYERKGQYFISKIHKHTRQPVRVEQKRGTTQMPLIPHDDDDS